MRFDYLRRAAHGNGLDHVRIKRSLHQPLDIAFFFFDPMGLFIEHGNEFVADKFALCLWIGYPSQLIQKTVGCVHGDNLQAQLVPQTLLYFFKLVLAQHPVVDEYAGQSRLVSVSQGTVNQGRSNGRIHSA